MKCDIILAGVGGQGVLAISAIIASSALKAGLRAKQSEVHGMAQRGGAVLAHLRLSDEPIASDIIPRGTADMILSMEPLESLLEKVRSVPGARLIEAEALARKAGSARATNMVIVGAASHLLPIGPEAIEAYIAEAFSRKGPKVVETNIAAFRAGRETVAAA